MKPKQKTKVSPPVMVMVDKAKLENLIDDLDRTWRDMQKYQLRLEHMVGRRERMLFKLDGSRWPIPLLPRGENRIMVADGETILTCRQMVDRFGEDLEHWRKYYLGMWAAYMPDQGEMINRSEQFAHWADPEETNTPTDKPQMVFEVIQGRPEPILPRGLCGYIQPDHERYLSPEQCAKRFGGTKRKWRDAWIKKFEHYLPSDERMRGKCRK